MFEIEQLRHTLTFYKGASVIDGTNNLVSAEVTVGANQVTKCNLILSNDQTVGVGDSFALRLGYGSSLWTITAPPTLTTGSSGTNVTLLETLLKEHGALQQIPGTVFDTDTYNALRLYQGWYGLTQDGACGPITWGAVYRNTSYTPTEPGRFYIDSFRRTNEYITLDGVELKIPGVTNAPVTQVSLTQIAAIADIGVRLGYPVINDPTGIYQVGNAQNPQQNVENKSSTSAADLLFSTGKNYGNFNYIWDDRIYTRWFQAYWNEPELPIINDTDILEIDRASTSIDAPKFITNVLFKANTFYTYTIPYTTYGYTLDLASEGYNHEAGAADRRLRGATIEGIKNIASVRVTTYGRLGDMWLPGRACRLYQQDGTTLAGFWIIREHTMRYSVDGFTSSFYLQAMQF